MTDQPDLFPNPNHSFYAIVIHDLGTLIVGAEKLPLVQLAVDAMAFQWKGFKRATICAKIHNAQPRIIEVR